MKLGTTSEPVFAEAVMRLSRVHLPPKAAYQISKLLVRMEKENKRYHELRTTILKKYAVTNTEGEIQTLGEEKHVLFIDPPAKAACLKELQELYEIPIEVTPLPLALFGEKTEVDGGMLAALSEIITEE